MVLLIENVDLYLLVNFLEILYNQKGLAVNMLDKTVLNHQQQTNQ